MQTLQNFVGWNGQTQITKEIEDRGYGGNVNKDLAMNGMTVIDLSNESLRDDDEV